MQYTNSKILDATNISPNEMSHDIFTEIVDKVHDKHFRASILLTVPFQHFMRIFCHSTIKYSNTIITIYLNTREIKQSNSNVKGLNK